MGQLYLFIFNFTCTWRKVLQGLGECDWSYHIKHEQASKYFICEGHTVFSSWLKHYRCGNDAESNLCYIINQSLNHHAYTCNLLTELAHLEAKVHNTYRAHVNLLLLHALVFLDACLNYTWKHGRLFGIIMLCFKIFSQHALYANSQTMEQGVHLHWESEHYITYITIDVNGTLVYRQ